MLRKARQAAVFELKQYRMEYFRHYLCSHVLMLAYFNLKKIEVHSILWQYRILFALLTQQTEVHWTNRTTRVHYQIVKDHCCPHGADKKIEQTFDVRSTEANSMGGSTSVNGEHQVFFRILSGRFKRPLQTTKVRQLIAWPAIPNQYRPMRSAQYHRSQYHSRFRTASKRVSRTNLLLDRWLTRISRRRDRH